MRYLLAIQLAVATVAVAGDFSLDWSTMDGGGSLRASGAGFELSATVGQPDATIQVMVGSGFELTGGFWAISAGPGFGDCDGNGDIDIADFVLFADCIAGPENPTGLGCTCLDPDSANDGDCDLRDFAEFQRVFGGTGE